MLNLLILVVLIVALFSAPWYPYSRSWTYYPSGGLVVLLIVVVLLVALMRP
jgi:hypothetical protein